MQSYVFVSSFFYMTMKRADYTGEMNPVSQTAASLVVFVLAITAVMAHAL